MFCFGLRELGERLASRRLALCMHTKSLIVHIPHTRRVYGLRGKNRALFHSNVSLFLTESPWVSLLTRLCSSLACLLGYVIQKPLMNERGERSTLGFPDISSPFTCTKYCSGLHSVYPATISVFGRIQLEQTHSGRVSESPSEPSQAILSILSSVNLNPKLPVILAQKRQSYLSLIHFIFYLLNSMTIFHSFVTITCWQLFIDHNHHLDVSSIDTSYILHCRYHNSFPVRKDKRRRIPILSCCQGKGYCSSSVLYLIRKLRLPFSW